MVEVARRCRDDDSDDDFLKKTLVTDYVSPNNSGECFYCKRGFSSRCEKCLLFGCHLLDGGQAEYVSYLKSYCELPF